MLASRTLLFVMVNSRPTRTSAKHMRTAAAKKADKMASTSGAKKANKKTPLLSKFKAGKAQKKKADKMASTSGAKKADKKTPLLPKFKAGKAQKKPPAVKPAVEELQDWSADDDALIRKLVAEGVQFKGIAKQLDTYASAVRKRHAELVAMDKRNAKLEKAAKADKAVADKIIATQKDYQKSLEEYRAKHSA
jgi:hypothetical protein